MATLTRIDFAIRAEFDLISQRMMWLMTTESFLLTAYTLGYTQLGDADAHPNLHFVLSIIPPVAISLSMMVWLSILGALGNVTSLTRHRHLYEIEFDQAMRVTALSSIYSRGLMRLRNLPPLIVPGVLAFVWLVYAQSH